MIVCSCIEKKNCAGKIDDPDMTYRNQLVDVEINLIKAPILHAENGIYIEASMKTVFYQSPKNSSSLKLMELSKFYNSINFIDLWQDKSDHYI